MPKHVHAEIIKAWADGAEIEFKSSNMLDWTPAGATPGWSPHIQYRVRHKWQKEIDAQAAGKAVQYQRPGSEIWWDGHWDFHGSGKYRIRPESVVKTTTYVFLNIAGVVYVDVASGKANLELTFEDDTLIKSRAIK